MDWQDIATAPRDGTAVFLWLPEIPDQQHARRIETRWMGFCWANEFGNGPAYNVNARPKNGMLVATWESIQPSHWMPLPSPPSEPLGE